MFVKTKSGDVFETQNIGFYVREINGEQVIAFSDTKNTHCIINVQDVSSITQIAPDKDLEDEYGGPEDYPKVQTVPFSGVNDETDAPEGYDHDAHMKMLIDDHNSSHEVFMDQYPELK